MGVQNSSLSQIQALGRGNQRSIQNTYYHKIYLYHKKNMTEFKQALTSIIKRSSYLRYSWTQQLLELLRNTSKDHLYHHYKTVLKENCLPTGHHQQTFYAAQTRDFFRGAFERHKQYLKTHPDLKYLAAVAQECKAFLMVMAWLHQLTELESNAQEACFQESRERWDEGEEESVCSGLLGIAELCFEMFVKEYPGELRSSAKLQQNIIVILKKLKRKSSFVQREAILQELEDNLSKQGGIFVQQLQDICQIFGRAIVLAHVFVVKEMAAPKLLRSWEAICPSLDHKNS